MTSNDFKHNVEQWIDLSRSGKWAEADRFYYAHLFKDIIASFAQRHAEKRNGELLVSLLGFSPEPVILMANALSPETHLIITNSAREDIINILDTYLDKGYKLVLLHNDDFLTIYRTIKETLSDYPTRNITIDITGGKKSMVASAAIFGKDYGSRIVYVDFSGYLKDIRKPTPGTEILNIVYDPAKDQPEINELK